MDIFDFILFPLYAMLFYAVLKLKSRKIAAPELRKYYRNGFYARLIGTFSYSIFLVYISGGDSFSTYYAEGLNIFKSALKDISIIDKMIFTKAPNIDPALFSPEVGGSVVFGSESNYMVARLAGVSLFFSFGKYMIANLLFSMLAYEGCWRLYKFFYEQYPHLHKEFAISVLYFPTFIFWSSGISKEAVCIAGLGFMTYGLFNIFVKKKDIISSSFWVTIFAYFLLNVKIYILLSYIPFLSLFFILKNILFIKSSFIRLLIGPVFIFIAVVGFVIALNYYKDSLGSYSIDTLTESMQKQQTNFQLQDNSESNFSLGVEFDATLIGIVKIFPAAIFATLFRPLVWEAAKLSSFLSSLESLVLLIFTLFVLFKAGIRLFLRCIFQKPLILFCFFFAIIFGLFVGATTLNFGSLVRYKIPCLPFYAIALFLIYDEFKRKKGYTVAPVPAPPLKEPAAV